MPDLWCDVDVAVIVPVNIMPLLDDTTFKDIETAVVYNSAGMALTWNFQTPAGVVTGTAVTPTTGGDYDWSEPVADKGMYAIEIPASGGASINNNTEGCGWFTGVATGVLPWRGPSIGFRRAALNDLLIEGSTASTNLEDFFDGTGYAGGTAKLTVDAVAISGDTTAADNCELMFDGTGYAGGTARLKTDVDTIKTQAVTCAAGVTVLASVGTAATSTAQTGDTYALANGANGFANLKTDTAAILVDTGTTLDGRIPAALTANGNMKSSLLEILTTALTETVGGYLAAAFKKFFDKATPTGTINSLPDAVAGAASGIAIVGSQVDLVNAPNATAVTAIQNGLATPTNITAGTITTATNLTTNNDKTGYAIGIGGIAAAAFAANAWDAAALAADAGTEIGTAVWASAARTLTSAASFQIKKNTELAAFPFVMTDSTNHVPSTGLTVTATRSIDGAAFGACANSVAEVSSGWYKITLAAADVNGTTIALRFTAAASDDLNITFVTQA